MAQVRNSTRSPVAATITGIARKAGVSHALVSIVLNDRADEMRISAETAQRIRDIAREMNYVPNHLARGLRGKPTNTVGVLWSLCGPHHSEGVTRRLTLLAQQRGYATSVADSLSDAAVIRQSLSDFARRHVDGVILQVGHPTLMHNKVIMRALESFKAVVLVSRQGLQTTRDMVVQESRDAMHEAVGRLVGAGRRRLAFLGHGASSFGKRDDLAEAMRLHGLDPQGVHLIDFEYVAGVTTPAEICASFEAQLKGRRPFDALLCGCDELAAAAMMWLRDKGWRTPQDVAVVGFNDSHLSAFFNPPIASIARCDDVVADAAIELLFNRLADPQSPRVERVVQMRFVARGSAGC